MKRLAVLGSTRGTVMLDIITAIQQKKLDAKIEIVLSNKQDALILEKARSHDIPAQWINPKNMTRNEFDEQVSQVLHRYQVDLVVLIGYMRILSEHFINQWRNKIINIHPSLLPAFAGSMDREVHDLVLKSGVKETGCTVHYVTEEVDAGPIVVQKKCPVQPNDTIEDLKNRVQRLEGIALIEAIQSI